MDVVYSLHFFPVLCTSMDKQQRAPAAYLIKKSCWILSERKISKFLCFIWTCPLWSHANFHVAASLLTSFWAKHLLSLISEVCKLPDLDPGESEVSCGGRRRLKEATEKKTNKEVWLPHCSVICCQAENDHFEDHLSSVWVCEKICLQPHSPSLFYLQFCI